MYTVDLFELPGCCREVTFQCSDHYTYVGYTIILKSTFCVKTTTYGTKILDQFSQINSTCVEDLLLPFVTMFVSFNAGQNIL